MYVGQSNDYSTCLAGSPWAGESGTVIGEEGSRKGKCGGGEALEAVEAHGALVVAISITYATLPADHLPSFSLSLSSLCFAPRDSYPSLFLILLRDRGGVSDKRKREREREGTPHDRIAKLKARHKPFYTPTRSTLALARPIIPPSASLSLSSFFFSYPSPLPRG